MPKIIYEIEDGDDYIEFKTYFLEAEPAPIDMNDVPLMTEGEWIKEWGKQQFINAYKRGKRTAALEAIQEQADLIKMVTGE